MMRRASSTKEVDRDKRRAAVAALAEAAGLGESFQRLATASKDQRLKILNGDRGKNNSYFGSNSRSGVYGNAGGDGNVNYSDYSLSASAAASSTNELKKVDSFAELLRRPEKSPISRSNSNLSPSLKFKKFFVPKSSTQKR
jgi:hypothetical protein